MIYLAPVTPPKRGVARLHAAHVEKEKGARLEMSFHHGKQQKGRNASEKYFVTILGRGIISS